MYSQSLNRVRNIHEYGANCDVQTIILKGVGEEKKTLPGLQTSGEGSGRQNLNWATKEERRRKERNRHFSLRKIKVENNQNRDGNKPRK